MDKKAQQSKIFGFIAMGLAILVIPMYFLPVVSVSFMGMSESVNLIDFFSAAEKAGEDIFVIIASVASMVFSLATAVFCIFPKKAMKLIAAILEGLAFALNVAMVILVFVKLSGVANPGIGLWLAMAFSLIAFALALVAAISAPKAGAIADGGYADGGYGYGDGGYGYGDGGYGGGYGDGSTVLLSGNITFLSGSCAGYQIPINSGEEIVIGKDPALCAIVIDKKYTKVSRKHCGVRYDANQNLYIVTDYSTNGTHIVGGQKLARNSASYISPGTTINLANTENSFRLG